MQNEGFAFGGFDQGGQLVLLLRRVDVRVAGVVENPEQAVQPDVDAGGLHHRVIERVDAETSSSDFSPKIAI